MSKRRKGERWKLKAESSKVKDERSKMKAGNRLEVMGHR